MTMTTLTLFITATMTLTAAALMTYLRKSHKPRKVPVRKDS